MKRLIGSVSIVVALAASTISTSAAAPSKSPCPLSVVPRDSGWVSIEMPTNPNIGDDGEGGAVAFTVDPTNPARIFSATTNEVWRTEDGGCNWVKVFNLGNSDLPVADCKRVDRRILVNGGCGYIFDLDYVESDGKGSVLMQVARINVGTGLMEVEIYRSSDQGDTWQVVLSDLVDMYTAQSGHFAEMYVHPRDRETVALARGPLYVSRDAGATWTRKELPLAATISGALDASTHRFAMDSEDPNSMWFSAFDASPNAASPGSTTGWTVWHSADQGTTWSQVPMPDSNEIIRGIAARDGKVVVAAQDVAWLSEDDGKTWRVIYLRESNSGGEYLSSAVIGPDGRFVFLIGAEIQVYRYDVGLGTTRLIKARSYSGLNDRLAYYGAELVGENGLFQLAACNLYKDSCAYLLRFTGKGT